MKNVQKELLTFAYSLQEELGWLRTESITTLNEI